ncbi:MAG: hypothetical protein WA324_12675 [Bryobacteraceae bacterium]
MEPLEFLGGKYQQPEQIVPGEISTFRAREASSQRSVFVHRIATSGGEAQQAALLRLLMQGIFRSPSARNQVLDFGEEPGFCYVVTDSSPQCLLLREWLQCELDSTLPGRQAEAQAEPPQFTQPPAATSQPPKPVPASEVESAPKPQVIRSAPDRIETKPDSRGGPVPFVIREQPVKPNAAGSLPPRAEVMRKESSPSPFEAKTPSAREFPPEPAKVTFKPEIPKVEPAPPSPTSQEPGEFTRFFTGGMPPAAPSRPEAFRSQDRPSHGAGPVQRPSNPPAPASKPEIGEFTKMFMRSGGQPATPVAPPPLPPRVNEPSSRTGSLENADFGSNNSFETPRSERLPDLSNRPSDLPNMFQRNAEVPTAMPSAGKEIGEYTRMFGKGGIPPPPQAPSAVGPAPVFRTDDPLGGSRFGMPSVTPAPPPPAQEGPSEFTRMMMGNRPQESPGMQGAAPSAAPPATGGAPGIGAPPAMGKPPAMPAIPGMGGAPAPPSGGPAAPMHPMQPMPMQPMQPMAPMGGGGMGNVRVTPINPMNAPGMGMNQGFSESLGPLGSAGANMGNPLTGQAAHMSMMTPLGQMHMGGGPMQHGMGQPGMGQPGASGGHPGAAGAPAGGGFAMPGAMPKAPNVGMGAKGKLLILFAVLGVLAIAMVLFVIFSSHK